MVPGQPIQWVSEGMLRHSHRPRPTLGAGQGPMLKSIGQEVARGDRQQRRVWLRENVRAVLTPRKVIYLLRSGEEHSVRAEVGASGVRWAWYGEDSGPDNYRSV